MKNALKFFAFVVILLVCLACFLLAIQYFDPDHPIPRGTFATVVSPDGKYEAEVSVRHDQFAARKRVEFSISKVAAVKVSSSLVHLSIKLDGTDAESLEIAEASDMVIWAEDSSSVTFHLLEHNIVFKSSSLSPEAGNDYEFRSGLK